MKIGLVSPYNIFRPGGVQTLIFAHYDELKKRGHEVKIIAPRPRVRSIEHNKTDVILVAEATPVNTPLHTMVDLTLQVDREELQRMLNKEKFDILHVHEPWVPRLPMQLLELSKAKNIATFHAKLPESPFNKSFEKAISPYTKQVFKHLDYLTAASNAAAEHVRSLGDGVNVEVIPCGIDLKLYDPKKVKSIPKYQDDIKTILYLGRLEKRKGTIYLIKAYEQLIKEHDDVRLLIASDGHKREMLENYVQTHEIPRVEFLGFVSNVEKRRLLKSSDLYCSPALYGEGFGVVLLESMAMDVVTVCGDNSGYSAVMTGKGNLSLVDPRSTNEFARRLELMLYDEDVRTMWRKWAADEIKQYDYQNIVDRYEKIYERLLTHDKVRTTA
ncbi:MAG TPA: glycosyltransferase family 4 protein [Candidatus Saccharimonadales bacterium]|nr:glycosyltransferase family 4 protein [Candidatus Saccharimonadales bacterium]